MQFSDVTNSSGILERVRRKVKADTTSYTDKQITASVNDWLNTAEQWIMEADGRWQYDDTNNTGLPIAYTDIVSGQTNYSFPTDILEIVRIDIAVDAVGTNWKQIHPFDSKDIQGMAYDEFQKASALPIYYDKVGNSIILKPTANYNCTGGLKIHYKRTASQFVSTDTTKTPGFALPFHKLLYLGASYDYETEKGTGDSEKTMRDILSLKADMQKFYARREKDEQLVLNRQPARYK